MQISWEKNWNRAHFDTLRQNYAKAPYFRRYEAMLQSWYARAPDNLSDFTIETTVELARELGILHTQFVRSSTLGCTGAKTERLLQILEKLGVRNYISGPAAKDYLDTQMLEQKGITVEWMAYDYPEYTQLHPPFDSHVSIVDLLMMTGEDAGRYIWGSDADTAPLK